MPLTRAVLELDVDIDPNTSGADTGVFEMVGNLEIAQTVETDHLLASGQGSTLNAIVAGNLDTVGDIIGNDTPDQANRAGFYLDGGGGRHTIKLNFNGWEGAEDYEGEPLQWGNTGDPNEVTRGDATGSNPLTQMAVFAEYIRAGTFDSRSPDARLQFGEYHEDGLFDDYLQVTAPRLRNNRVADDPYRFDGSIQLAEALPWNDVYDAVRRTEW